MRRLLALVCLARLVSCSVPGRPADPDGPLRALAYNIKNGVGMDGELDLKRVAALIRRVDYCRLRPGNAVLYWSLEVVDENLVSDHRPLLLDIWLSK